MNVFFRPRGQLHDFLRHSHLRIKTLVQTVPPNLKRQHQGALQTAFVDNQSVSSSYMSTHETQRAPPQSTFSLARTMTAALCRKRPSPLASGQPRTWACGIVYVLGRINFLGDSSFSPHMTTAELCPVFEVGDSTVHAQARAIEQAVGTHPADPTSRPP